MTRDKMEHSGKSCCVLNLPSTAGSSSSVQYRFLLLLLLAITIVATQPVGADGCNRRCGDIVVPYPFGLTKGCFRHGFNLKCDNSFSPPKLFLHPPYTAFQYEVRNISVASSQLTVDTPIAKNCSIKGLGSAKVDLSNLPYTISHSSNKFVALGYATIGFLSGDIDGSSAITGCVAGSASLSMTRNGTCSGLGCCKSSIWPGLKYARILVWKHNETSEVSPCSYVFLVDEKQYTFNTAQFSSFQTKTTMPTVLDWTIGNDDCSAGNICGSNTSCVNSTSGPGYRCSCIQGFTGNPYEPSGCQDIDECKQPSTNNCSHICANTLGSYNCSCPSGTYGDGRKNGKGCIPKNEKLPLWKVLLGVGFGLLFLLVGSSWLYWIWNKRRVLIMRQKFFEQNGGLFLRQQLSSDTDVAQMLTIFNSEDLKKATNNYDESRILGEGGQGIVYGGVLTDDRHVAIKTSKLADRNQARLTQFVNEMMVLSRIIHRSIVRLIGCCLETEIPMLVYEFIPNGSLSNYIYNGKNLIHSPSLSWENRLKIATETAEAIDHLHTAGNMPIIHSDIKSANILLDNDFNAKVSDFGVSKLVSLEETKINTFVQGTLGYLDPGYFQTGLLTEKSDVYSFGVVLVELLTGERPVDRERPEGQRNLANHFLLAMGEDRLLEILDPRIKNEADVKQLEAVARLARDCLNLRANQRPLMKEVAVELGKLMRMKDAARHSFVVHGDEADVENYDEPNTTGTFRGDTSRLVEKIIIVER